MEYGLIKDTTLTSIADSLRDKGIINKYKYGDIVLQYKSDNATSLEDPTPTQEHSLQKFTVDFSDITNAASIEFEVFPVVIAQSDTTDLTAAVAIIKYEKKSMSAVSYEYIYRDTEKLSFTTSLISTEITFQDNGTASSKQKDWAGIVVKAYPLDSSGNRIQGYTDELVQYTPGAMAEALSNSEIPVAPPEEAFTITGACNYRFTKGSWDWFIDTYGDKITTTDITNLSNAFDGCKTLERIPFVLNVTALTGAVNCFSDNQALRECPKIRGTFKQPQQSPDLNSMLSNCFYIRDAEELFEPSMLDFLSTIKVTSAYSCPRSNQILYNCYSLRSVPTWWYKLRVSEESTAYPYSSYTAYYGAFSNCYTLDEVLNAPVLDCQGAQTSNMFNNTVSKCYRLKDFTFETNNGQPFEAKWKTQTLDFTGCGYCNSTDGSYITGYNSGITKDKRVTDDASYQALKNDPDWYTQNATLSACAYYSRYNHDSAVNTINSLPDTSAYLATAGGTNTIKFTKIAGTKTDGGAIQDLTAEEIAVAAAKGWTVTLA